MSTRPMVPASGRGKMAPTTTGKNRPTMGKSAFEMARVDDASATDVRGGFLEARPEGIGTDQSIFGTGPARRQTEVNGPQFGITASHGAQSETYGGTLAAGRLMNPVMRSPGSEFSSSASGYGPTGPGSGSGGGGRAGGSVKRAKGAWKPPNSGKTS